MEFPTDSSIELNWAYLNNILVFCVSFFSLVSVYLEKAVYINQIF